MSAEHRSCSEKHSARRREAALALQLKNMTGTVSEESASALTVSSVLFPATDVQFHLHVDPKGGLMFPLGDLFCEECWLI